MINASSEAGMMVLNGMSYSHRSSAFSNAAIVVGCGVDDYRSTHPLAGTEFQKDIEKKAFNLGGGKWKVPAQNLDDYLSRLGIAASSSSELLFSSELEFVLAP